MDIDKILEVTKKAAVDAGIAIMKVYDEAEDMEITYKDGDMPLTAADKASNKIIVDILRKEFPEYSILSEEEKDDRSRLDNDYCFVVDPLDGTKEFIKRNGQFTVNIALAYKHESVLGVIYVPVTGELYYAAKGKGAYLDTEEEKGIRLSVSECTDIKNLPSQELVVLSQIYQHLVKFLEFFQFDDVDKSLGDIKVSVDNMTFTFDVISEDLIRALVIEGRKGFKIGEN